MMTFPHRILVNSVAALLLLLASTSVVRSEIIELTSEEFFTVKEEVAFQAIFDGDLNATSAFMTGKLSVDGDMGMAMKLAAVLA